MFSTSALYFVVAIFGESVESSEAHGLQKVQGQGAEETEEVEHNESQEASEIHNETAESEEQHQEEDVLGEDTNESEHSELEETEEGMHDEASENQRRLLELPLFVGSGIGYAAVGVWMILDKRNSKIHYIIAIVGSLILLGIYITSRTVGIPNLGMESVGLLDSIVAGLQVAIIITSAYILIKKTYTKGITVDKKR
jgi:hypothetical protein